MSCNQFQKDTVALRVLKPWRFQLHHTCHMHTVSLMSLCKYLIFSICITRPSLPPRPLVPAFSNATIQPQRTTWIAGPHHDPLGSLLMHLPLLGLPCCIPFLPAKQLHILQDSARICWPFWKPCWHPLQLPMSTEFLVSSSLPHYTWLTFHNPESYIYLFNKHL